MRNGGGKAKGSGFERDIAKAIVKAFAEFGIEQRECWRSVLSGGHEMSAGDLYLSDRLMQLFPWAPEMKSRKKINFRNFFEANEKSEEMKWLKQAMEGARKIEGLKALLVMKENHQKVMVLKELSVEHTTRKMVLKIGDQFWEPMSWDDFIKEAVEEARHGC